MHYKVKLKITSTNYSTKPFKTELYMHILNVTGSIKDKYKNFINLKPVLIQGTTLQWWLNPSHKADYL